MSNSVSPATVPAFGGALAANAGCHQVTQTEPPGAWYSSLFSPLASSDWLACVLYELLRSSDAMSWRRHLVPTRQRWSHETVGAAFDRMGNDSASCSIAASTFLDNRRQGWIVTFRCCRCHTPAIVPSTITAFGA